MPAAEVFQYMRMQDASQNQGGQRTEGEGESLCRHDMEGSFISDLMYSVDGNDGRVNHCKQLDPEEEEEVMPVAAPDGVAHPGAEVVKEFYAAVRSGTVLSTQRPHNLAGHAQLLPLASPKRGGVYQLWPCTAVSS